MLKLSHIKKGLNKVITSFKSNTANETKKEYILCSAIWYKKLPLLRPEVLEPRGFGPYNVNEGVVFCGWRHCNCLYQMVAVTGLTDHEAGHGHQGFLTNTNRFVDRKEAAIIAYKAGQIKDKNKTYLFSEDVW